MIINFNSSEPTKKDELIDSLQTQLNKEVDARKEERWIWLVVTMVIFDIFSFKDFETWSAPLIVGIIQLIIMVVLGRRWQMDHIWTLTEKLLDKWDGKIGR